jgi:hypothetical protein
LILILILTLTLTLQLLFSTGDSSYKKLTAGGTQDLMLAEEGNGIQMSTLGGGPPPAWVQDVDAIQECLTDIQQRMEQLQSMHATRVGSVFGRDLDDMEGRIEKMTSSLTDQFRVAERLLQKVGVVTRRAGGEEATVGANVQRRYVLFSDTVSYRVICYMATLWVCTKKEAYCFLKIRLLSPCSYTDTTCPYTHF